MTSCRWAYCDPDTCICNDEREEEDRRVMQADFERGIYERADAEDRDTPAPTTSNGEGL